MDREIVLGVLGLVLLAIALFAAGIWPYGGRLRRTGRQAERALWLAIWLRLVPAMLVLAGLLGWALQEPDPSDEAVGRPLVFAGAVVGAIWARALVRAVAALRGPGDEPAVTFGLVRPRVLVAPWFTRLLDPKALEAVHKHEQAHARHRDPLRIWLAQLATDLLWPLPAPALRFHRWLRALEIARDEEVRECGIHGADLAAAVLVAAQCIRPSGPCRAAIVRTDVPIAERIDRLLAPLPQVPPRASLRWALSLLAASVVSAGVLGYRFGETVVRALPGVLT